MIQSITSRRPANNLSRFLQSSPHPGRANDLAMEVDTIEDLWSLHRSLEGRLSVCERDSVLVIHGARLIDGLGNEPRERTTLIARGGTIEKVIPDAQLGATDRQDAKVVDAAGRSLLPGLVDAHFHFTGRPKNPNQRELEANEDVRALRAARDGLTLLNAGFTAAKSMGHGRPDLAVALKLAMAEGFLLGPTIRHSGWAFSQSGGHGINPAWPLDLVETRRPRSAFADGVEGIRTAVRRNFGEGADFVKLYATQGLNTSPIERMNIPNYTIDELRMFAAEAHRHRTLASAHATGSEGCLNAVRAGIDTIEHGPDEFDEQAEELLDLMKTSGTLFVPTLAHASKVQHRTSFTADMKAQAAKRFQGKQAFFRAAVEKGIPIAAGTDYSTAPLAGCNADELCVLHHNGLSALQAIAAATSVAARAMGVSHLLGALRPGLASDLLLVDGDPSINPAVLANTHNIQQIFKSRYTWDAPPPL